MHPVRCLALAVILTGACSKSREEAPRAPASPQEAFPPGSTAPGSVTALAAKETAASPPLEARASANEVALTIEGAITAKLEGRAGSCSLRKSGAIPGATFQVRSEELGVTPAFNLTVIAEANAFQDPTIALNVTAPERAHYVRNRAKKNSAERIMLAEDATSADLDVTLQGVATPGTVRLKGSIRCAKPLVCP
jgi:hypothetical protein